MDVGLILDQLERQFLNQLSAAAAQIAIEFVSHEPSNLLWPVLALKHHHRRVLRHRLGEHRRALDVGAQHLVAEPLVRDLVCGHIERIVDVLRVL